MIITVGATLTGGTATTYASGGHTPNGAVYVGPDHTRLEPRQIRFTSGSTPSKGSVPGFARTGVQINFSDVVSSDGCCGGKVEYAIADLGIRFSQGDPAISLALVDEVIAALRGLVFDTEFVDAVKKGILPA